MLTIDAGLTMLKKSGPAGARASIPLLWRGVAKYEGTGAGWSADTGSRNNEKGNAGSVTKVDSGEDEPHAATATADEDEEREESVEGARAAHSATAAATAAHSAPSRKGSRKSASTGVWLCCCRRVRRASAPLALASLQLKPPVISGGKRRDARASRAGRWVSSEE